MGDVLEGHFRPASGAVRPLPQGGALALPAAWRAQRRQRPGAPALAGHRDPAAPPSVDIDAIAELGSTLGHYVGCRLAAERARIANDLIEVIHRGHADRLDAVTLEGMTEEIRQDEVVDAAKSMGRSEFRQVAQAFRAALSRILDGP